MRTALIALLALAARPPPRARLPGAPRARSPPAAWRASPRWRSAAPMRRPSPTSATSTAPIASSCGGHGRPPRHADDPRPRRPSRPRLPHADLQRARRAARLAALPRREHARARAGLGDPRRRVGGPRAITGPPNAFSPAFASPDVLTFWRRQAAYTIAIANRTAGAKTRLPDGAASSPQVAKLADGRLVAVWPSGGAIFSATRAPGATAFGAADAPLGAGRLRALAAAGPHARRPRGRRVDAVRRHGAGLVTAAGRRAAPSGRRRRTASSEQVLTVRALGSSAGDVLVAFVSARADIGSGPLRALRLGPNGWRRARCGR